jgi:Holliday junction resolvase RusA-like endonuclease
VRFRKASKPDADNIEKAVLDGLQRHGWLDDDARCTPRIERWRGAPGEAAHTVVEVSVLPWVGD